MNGLDLEELISSVNWHTEEFTSQLTNTTQEWPPTLSSPYPTQTSPKPLMSWSTCLESQPKSVTPQPSTPLPYKAQRAVRKTSGLFDTGSTGVAGKSTTSVDTVAADNYDWISALESEDDVFADSTNTLLPSLEESLNVGMAESEFLEGFMDLSRFLGLEGDDEVGETPMEVSVESLTQAVKRTASDAFGSTEQVPANSDHDCYVSKKSRIASCSDSTCTDAESDAIPSSSGTPKVDKYRNRRIKNNIASKRSRETRKQKFQDMEKKAVELEKANAELKQKVELLEQLTKQMKETLVKKLAGK